jgi:small subunit ribosomal protein S13
MKHKFFFNKETTPLNDFSQTYGIGYIRIKIASIKQGLNPLLKPIVLKSRAIQVIKKKFKNMLCSKNLREYIKKKLLFLWYIKLYRGVRNMLRLPCRGQRTHTNAKTKKKFKLF